MKLYFSRLDAVTARRGDNSQITWLTACVLALSVNTAAASASEVAVDSGIKMIEAVENRIETLRWKFNFQELTPSGSAKGKSPVKVDGSVTYDITNGRYLLTGVETLKWRGGANPYLSKRFGMAFDGDRYQEWNHEWHGTQPPPEIKNPEAGISAGIDAATLIPDEKHAWPTGWVGKTASSHITFDTYSNASGLQFIGPLFHPRTTTGSVVKLSAYLRAQLSAAVPVTITASDNILHITTVAGDGSEVHLTVDLARRAAIKAAEWRIPGQTVLQYEVKYDKTKDGDWVPRECIEKIPIDQIGHQINFSSFEWNPRLTSADFQLKMPPGTRVSDATEGISYNIGKGPDKEAEDVRKYVDRNGLDTLKAKSNSQSRWTFRTLLIGVNTVLILLLAVVVIRKRRAALMLLLALSAAQYQTAAANPVLNPDGVWTLKRSDRDSSQTAQITQCGFHVAILTLELTERKYSPRLVSEALDPRTDGISAIDLQRVLESHGLLVEARKNVPVDSLFSSVTQDRLAIFVIPVAHEQFHYLVAVRDARDRILILDPPLSCRELTHDSVKTLTADGAELLVLYVSKPFADSIPLAKQVALSPELVDLGPVELHAAAASESNGETREVQITNNSSRPIMVCDIIPSCGCAVPNSHGGLLNPQQEKKVSVKIDTRSWGFGDQSKSIALTFADGSIQKIDIRGKGFIRDTSPDIRSFSSRHVVVEAPMWLPAGTWTLNKENALVIPRAAEQIRIKVVSASKWISPTLRNSKGQTILDLVSRIGEEESTQLEAPGATLEGFVRLHYDNANSNVDDLVLTIAVVRPHFGEAVPELLEIERGRIGQFKLQLSGSDNSIGDTWSEPDGLHLAEKSVDGNQHIIDVDAQAGAKPGLYLAKCKIMHQSKGAAKDRTSLLSSVVLLKDANK